MAVEVGAASKAATEHHATASSSSSTSAASVGKAEALSSPAGSTGPDLSGLKGSAAEHAKEASGPKAEVEVHYDALHPPSRNEILVAWFPWLLVAVLVCIWGVPPVKGDATLNPKTGLQVGTLLIPMTGLNGQVRGEEEGGGSVGSFNRSIFFRSGTVATTQYASSSIRAAPAGV